MISEQYVWDKIIQSYYERYSLISHQIDSFNSFLHHGLHDIITCGNIHVKDKFTIIFSNIVIEKPIVYESNRKIKKLTPYDARTRDLTYSSKILVTVNLIDHVKNTNKIYNMIPLCEIPIMLKSNFCNLYKLNDKELIKANECLYDKGGYFIIRGKERVLVSQIRNSYNIPCVYEISEDNYCCEVRSMSEINGHSVLIKLFTESRKYLLDIPYIKESIPIGIVFAALGYCFEDEITSLLSLEEHTNKIIKRIMKDIYLELKVQNTEEKDKMREEYIKQSLIYIAKRSITQVKEDKYITFASQIINIEILPHMGIQSTNKEKMLYLCNMVTKFLKTELKIRKPDDRDNYMYKRVETSGILCYELFRQLFKKYKDSLLTILEKQKDNIDIISCMNRINVITKGFSHCFATGNWGVPKTSYIRAGVSQVLSRLSYGSTISHTRRLSIPIGKESKNTKIRQIHPSQYGFICPCETPEGQPVGIVLNFSLLTTISKHIDTYIIIDIVQNCKNITLPEHVNIYDKFTTSVFVNGYLCGYTTTYSLLLTELYSLRQNGIIHSHVSFVYNNIDCEIIISCDAGRLLRPVFTLTKNQLNINENIDKSWDELVDKDYIRWLDPGEANNHVIALNENELNKFNYDYCELTPCIMLGVMGSIIPWPDHSQSPRNCYQTSMGKQAMSIYALSYQLRTDTITHVLGYPQRPLVSTRGANLMGFNEMGSGVNTIVAIACYTGFNQEDSVIINHSAIQRGLFVATSYRTHTQQEKKEGLNRYETFGCPPINVQRSDSNYGLLDSNGIIIKRFKDGKSVYVRKGDVIIGKYIIDKSKNNDNPITDCSVVIKKGEEGFVDKIINTITPDGYKMVKIVIRQERIPEVGDKVASRAAQKGTCGMVLAQQDMPWTAEGIVPDIIINPHCIPSRMTINQLMESVLGKSCCITGEIGDATPFGESSVNISQYLKDKLELVNFNGDGTEVLYSGYTGEALGEVFIGPVYYQRLKHLVAEKIHARSTGPVTTLTKQPLEGRSRDGGLRFGEMERDAMISHGTSMFLKERLCDESDPYQLPICPKCKNISTTYSKCEICNNNEEIPVVGIPYISKLVLQELNAMCIKTDIEYS